MHSRIGGSCSATDDADGSSVLARPAQVLRALPGLFSFAVLRAHCQNLCALLRSNSEIYRGTRAVAEKASNGAVSRAPGRDTPIYDARGRMWAFRESLCSVLPANIRDVGA